MKPVASTAVFRRLAIVIPLMVFCALMYTFLHEGGHAVFGLLFGGQINNFNINFFDFSAHVALGGDFSVVQRAIISVAGVSLPLLAWALVVSLLPVWDNPLAQWLKILLSLGVINSLLAWIVIPLLYLSGNAPGDDSTNFLSVTGFSPLLVSLAALLFYLGGWLLFFRRMGGWDGVREVFRDERGVDLKAPQQRKTLGVLLAISVVALAITLGLNTLAPAGGGIPAGYTLLGETILNERGYSAETLAAFELASPAQVQFFFVIDAVNQGPFQLELRGSNGYSKTYFQMLGNDQIGHATIQPEAALLDPGKYEVLLTSPINPSGKVGVYGRGLP